MQKVIDQITDQLVSLVTNDRAEYTPKELLKSGIPSFVVERIRLFLEDKVREEIGTSSPLWFDRQTRLVADAFQDYVRSAISTSRIPKEELYNVVHSVVKDIILVFIEPRKNMAEYLFRDDEELQLEEIQERCSYLTIYKHFGTAIPLYMEKRNLDSLTKQRCKLLIQKLDTKLVASYTPQDWAQKLEQLFILFGGKVHPMLLSIFFKDKGLYRMSEKFERMDTTLSKADFIQIISDEDITAFVAEEAPPQVESEKKKEEPNTDSQNIESLFSSYADSSEEPEPEKDTIAGHFLEMSLSDEEMSELLSDIAGDGVVEVDDFEQVDSLNKLFSLSNESSEENQVSETSEEIAAKIKQQKEDDTQEIAEFRENLISILDQAKNSFETIEKKEEPEEIEVEEDIADVFVSEEDNAPEEDGPEDIFEEELTEDNENDPDEESEEKPIWAQFLNKDQMDVLMGGERNSNKESVLAEEYEEEIHVDDTYQDEPVFESEVDEEEEPFNFETILEDRKAEFIEVIFSGSEKKYEKALEKITGFSTWKETSAFLQKDIFKKNNVDLFSGATVDFTDRLHQYFNEQRNRNS